MITKEQLNQILTDNHYITISTAAVDVVVEDVNQMNCSDNERAMFLAHMIHESFGFTRWVEKNGTQMNYTPHYGRGYIYLTYRRNYRAYSRAIFGNPQELDENPDRVCESEKTMMRASMWVWENLVRPNGGPSRNNFYLTTKAIKGENEPVDSYVSLRRYSIYTDLARLLGVTDLAVNEDS
ncbi:hypothetical protein RP20_CCG016476 [Aedes albopictus]|nr:acidic endochitinase SP2 [Aedes albopictus]KXJ73116.1 hypothetical protein RP20_CCG016476 [Aedes albopictus]